MQFVAIPTTVVVPGVEEKEHRSGGGDGPAVRVKEIHPGERSSSFLDIYLCHIIP